jgi:hypothetical protein
MNILKCKVIYEIILVLLRTLRFLRIKTCGPTEELGGGYTGRLQKNGAVSKNLLNDYILQMDGASPHFHSNVREQFNRVLQQRWIGRAANGDNHIHIVYGTNSITVWMCVV